MVRSAEELVEILRDETRPMEERIEAAKELYKWYKRGATVPAIVVTIARESVDELKERVENEDYAKGTEEEALVRGIYEAKVEEIKRRLESMPLTEIVEIYMKPRSKVEYEIAEKMLSGEVEKLEEKAKVLSKAAEILRAKAIAEHAEFIKKSTPKIAQPNRLGFLSELQVELISKPTKWYAKQAFMNGIWNLKWGDPEEYGIDVERMVSYVSRPMNRDFAALVFARGIWKPEWGEPEDYGIMP